MRKLVWLFCLISALVLPAAAQDYPKVEVFGGYSYFHSSFAGTGLGFPGSASGSITVNFTPILGVTGDFGGYHRSESSVSTNDFTYLFGPKFTYRGNEHVTPFFHILVGGAHASSSSSTIITTTGGTSTVSGSSNAFAFATGGGLDVNVAPHIAIRVAQVDYLLTKFQDDQDNRQNNVRISAGMLFRWGGAERGH